MSNKKQIQKLKDYAELAWAAYGYFHLANESYKLDENSKDWKRLEYFRKLYKNNNLGSGKTNEQLQSVYPTYADILDITYKYYLDDNGKPKDGLLDDELFGGDFGKEQAQRFFERYDLLKHQPNTNSGFSATLFQNKETKEYTLVIRGTELKEAK